MKLEVLTIGDEILSGNITDTNFTWLGERLWSRGFELHWHTTVGDEPETIRAALMAAVGRSEAVVVTGGLGPTTDDITLEVAAQAFGLPLVLNRKALADIQEFFAKFKKSGSDRRGSAVEGEAPSGFARGGGDVSPYDAKQAMLPEGSRMIPNSVGTAPGCHLVFRGTHFFFLPGVPREMKSQFDNDILPKLVALLPEKINFSQKILRCFGLPEATIGQKLEGMDLYTIDLAYRVFFPEILLKISGRGTDSVAIQKSLSDVETEIRVRLGDIVYAEGEEMLPAVVGRLLTEKKATLATAESCTGGLLSSLITDVPGSSRYFERSVVTYSNDAKVELLDVPMQTILKHGAVSSETAIAMAQGMRRLAGTTYALAVTGISGPEGGTPQKPMGTVHIALDFPEGTQERKFHFPTNREWFKRVASFAALDLLRKKLAT